MSSIEQLPEQKHETFNSEVDALKEQSHAEYSTRATNGLTRYIKTGLAIGGSTVAGAFGVAGMANAAPSREESVVAHAAQESEYTPEGKPVVTTAKILSDKELKMYESFRRNSVKSYTLLSNTTEKAYEDDNNTIGRLDFSVSKNKDRKFVWTHKSRVKLYGVREEFNDGTVRYTRRYPERSATKNRAAGNSIVERHTDDPTPKQRLTVSLYFTKR